MRIEELPDSQFVTIHFNPEIISVALRSILGNGFSAVYMAPVYDSPQSIRIICGWQYADTIRLPRPSSAWQMANHLQDFTEMEARYDPPKKPGFKKGWEIRRAEVEGGKIVIALAHWVSY